VDDRIYNNAADGKTKSDHFKDMLVNAITDKGLQTKTVLFDSWYRPGKTSSSSTLSSELFTPP
jgi:hypothetical protein